MRIVLYFGRFKALIFSHLILQVLSIMVYFSDPYHYEFEFKFGCIGIS